jgi:hypothetical protein
MDIIERLRPLLPPTRETTQPPHKAQIDDIEDGESGTASLRLRLFRTDGYVIGDRQLSLEGNCQEIADAVAAIIAAWETAPMPDSPPKEVEVPAHLPSSPAPAPAAQPSAIQIFAGVGAGVAMIGGLAAAGRMELVLGRTMSRWQLRLEAATQSPRQLDLSPGQVDWHHTTLASGMVLRSLHPTWLLSLDAGPVVGLATLAGSGYSKNRRRYSFEFGGVGGLRGGRRFGRIVVWADSRAMLWALAPQARVKGSNSHNLPFLDIAATLGISVLIY